MGTPIASENGIDPTKLFSLQLKALRLVIMWPVKKTNLFVEFMAWSYFWFLTILMVVCTVGLFIKSVNSEDLVDRSEAIDILTLVFSACYKMQYFVWGFHGFEQIVEMGQRFEPHLPPGWLAYTSFFTKLHCALGFVAISLWGLCPMLEYVGGFTDLEEVVLPINVYFPFEVPPFIFCLCYALCCTSIIASTMVYMSVDAFFFTSIHVANGVLNQIASNLSNVAAVRGSKGDRAQIEYLEQNVQLHVDVIRFVRKLDSEFSSMIMADVLHAIISLTFAMFQLTESHGFFQWCKMVFFVSVCYLHQYLNSYFGQALIQKQEELYNSISGIPWADGSKAVKNFAHMMYVGMMKPIKLSAWNMYVLQYETFMEFVRSMISYFMVLRQLNEESEKME